MRSALVVLVVMVGCKAKQEAIAHGDCLPLPHAQRHTLRADPAGNGLYWIERVSGRDYEGLDASYDRLVRYDLDARHATVIFEPVAQPLQFTKDGGVLVISRRGTAGALLHIRDGFVQSMLPSYFEVKDVEPIEGARYAVAAGADGKWRIFTLDLDAPRPLHLFDGDVLLSAVRDTVFVRDEGKTFAIDVESGASTPREAPPSAIPDRDLAYVVEDMQVKVRSLATNDVRTLVDDRRDWTLLHQSGSVIARAVDADGHHAVWLSGGKATVMPRLRGGAAIVGLAQHADKTYALVGHNTSNYDGDLWATPHEADVCVLDRRKELIDIPTRQVPARYAAAADAFWAAARTYPDSRWQILDEAGGVTTMYAVFDAPGGDVEKLRDRVREVHKKVTRTLGDDEIRTRLEWSDGRTASYGWRREHLRGRAASGMGEVQVTDAADFDLELADAVIAKIDGGKRVRCAGKLTNLRSVTLVDIDVRCLAGDRERVIRIAKLDPKEAQTFAKTFDALDNDVLVIEVFRGRSQQVVRDAAAEALARERLTVFVELHDTTKLAVRGYDFTTERFFVNLQAPPEAKLGDIALPAVADAYQRLDAARARLHVEPALELELRLYIDRKEYAWDGTELVLVE